MDPKFERLLIDACRERMLVNGYLIVATLAVGGLFLIGGLYSVEPWYVLIGALISLFGYGLVKFNKGIFKGGRFWAKLIAEKPEEIIWIVPKNEETTINNLFTVEYKSFELCTTDPSLYLVINCKQKHNRALFFDSIHKYLPNAHFGTNEKVQQVYHECEGKDFLKQLHAKGLYRPVLIHQHFIL